VAGDRSGTAKRSNQEESRMIRAIRYSTVARVAVITAPIQNRCCAIV
jgi:hypothetical protein